MSLSVLAAILTSLLSAGALYAASPHCRWPAWRRFGRHGRALGMMLALVSLAIWIAQLGIGAGLCAMLGNWMLAMMVLPYLAWRTVPGTGDNGSAR